MAETKREQGAALLSKFITKTKLIIKGISDDSGENQKLCKIELAAPINAVGSQTTDQGAPIRVEGAQFALVTGDVNDPENPDNDLAILLEGLTDNGDGTMTYEGPLKFDVNKPRGRVINGTFQVTNPPKLWVVSVAFNRRGGGLRRDAAQGLSKALEDMFGKGTAAPAATATTGPKVVQNQP